MIAHQLIAQVSLSPTIDLPTCESMSVGERAGVRGNSEDARASCDPLIRPSDTFSPDFRRSPVVAAPGEKARDRGRTLRAEQYGERAG